MTQITDKNGIIVFRGNLDSPDDLSDASRIAAACPAYMIDEDDEDYLAGARSCFNCRYRRWLANGFSCLKGFPRVSPAPPERN